MLDGESGHLLVEDVGMDTEPPAVWRVSASDVPRLVSAILKPERRHSLTVVSPASDTGAPRIDVDRLVEQTRDLPTDVVLLDSMEASNRLSDSISNSFHCYGGSVRVVMPNARVTDHFRRHPLLLIYPDDDPALSLRRVVESIMRTPGLDSVAPATTVPERHFVIPKPGPRPAPSLARPSTTAGPQVPSPAPSAPGETTSVASLGTPLPEPLHTSFGLADIEAVVARAVARTLEEQLGGPNADAERERSRADTAEELLTESEQRNRRLEDENRSLSGQVGSRDLPLVYADAERQLRWEVETTWLMSGPEDRREESPLADWTIDRECLAGFDVPVVPRRKTIEVMIGILQGRGWEQSTTHQFLEHKAGKASTSPEGTSIWRTYVKSHSPQAPRLTWWQRSDGGYHFRHLGGHDELL